jgi:transcription factor TFIIIB component B''
MQTLSRLTGKDFTGPTPEIRARPPLTLHENPAESGGLSAGDLRKTSETPGVELDRADAEVVVRDAEVV